MCAFSVSVVYNWAGAKRSLSTPSVDTKQTINSKQIQETMKENDKWQILVEMSIMGVKCHPDGHKVFSVTQMKPMQFCSVHTAIFNIPNFRSLA